MKTINMNLKPVAVLLLTGLVTHFANFAYAEKLPKKSLVTFQGSIKQGTSDGAGGNSLSRKMLESYIFHPENSPAYNQKISSILAKIFVDDKGQNHALDLLRFKTWYLSPRKLRPIDKKVIGISFVDGGIDQVALQNSAEIWIDSELYEKMNPEEKGTLILHEVVMSYYLLQFEKMTDLCQRMQKNSVDESCPTEDTIPKESLEYFLRVFAPKPLRELTDQDYQNIRYMTHWLLEQGDALTQKRFWKVAGATGFDKRFLGQANDSENQSDKANSQKKNQDINISLEEFVVRLDSARLGNQLPKKCYSSETHKSFDCEISWQLSELKDESRGVKDPLKFLNLKVVNKKSGKLVIRASIFMSNTLDLWTTQSIDGDQNYHMISMMAPADEMQSVDTYFNSWYKGARLVSVAFSFDIKDGRLLKLTLVPYVFVGDYKITKEKDQSGQAIPRQECRINRLTRFKGDDLYSQGVVSSDNKPLKDWEVALNGFMLPQVINWEANCQPIR